MISILTPEMLEAVIDRREKYQHFQVNPLPHPAEVGPCIIGGASILSQSKMSRWLWAEKGIMVVEPGQGPENWLETPNRVARDYLRAYFKQPRIKHSQWEAIQLETYAPPFLAIPCHGDLVYLDIKATFPAILLRVGWNIDYYPGRWLAKGRTIEDFPLLRHKIARSCLVSCATKGTITRYDPEYGPRTIPSFNPLMNYGLIRLISDVLNALGIEAEKLGARYINTDGYIFESMATAEKMAGVIMDYGLTPRVKAQGPGEVYGIGSYRVGKIRTAILSRGTSNRVIRRVKYHRWLADSLSFWASRVKKTEVELC